MRAISFLLGLLMTVQTCSAGLAIFDPPVKLLLTGEVPSFDITLRAETLPNFDGADVLIVADAPFQFTYSDEWREATGPCELACNGTPLGMFPYDLYVGGIATTVGGLGREILLGTIFFDPGYLGPDHYNVSINSALDGGLSFLGRGGVAVEPIFGEAAFSYGIPEPSMCALSLSIAALLLSRKRL